MQLTLTQTRQPLAWLAALALAIVLPGGLLLLPLLRNRLARATVPSSFRALPPPSPHGHEAVVRASSSLLERAS